MMMYDGAPTHKNRKLVKTYKHLRPQKQIVVTEVCGETYSKNDKKWSIKTATNLKKLTPQIKGER